MRLVQKVGRSIAENFNLKVFTDWSQMTIYLLSFLFGVIYVVDYFLCLYNII